MSTQQTNKLRSTNVYGSFGNFDTSTGSILANGQFQRNLFVGGDLVLGTETIDASGNAIDSNSNIKFTLNKVLYSIPLTYLMNVTSGIQQQISNIPSTQNSVLGIMYLIPTVLGIFFFLVLGILCSTFFSVLGIIYLIPKFFIRYNMPNTKFFY